LTDLSQLSDDELMAMYQQAKTQDPVAVRQKRNLAEKQLSEDRAAYSRSLGYRQNLLDFNETNMKAGTGGWEYQLPMNVGPAIARMRGGPIAQLVTKQADLQMNSVPQGQGSVSNYERGLYGATQPNINMKGPDNTAIVNQRLRQIDREGKRLAFYEQWLNKNGGLDGAAEAWSRQMAQAGGTKRVPLPQKQARAQKPAYRIVAVE